MSYVPKKKNSKKRVIAIVVLIVVTFGLLISRLVYLQIVSGEEMLNKSQNRILKNNVINAPRGEIRDRNGIPLVTSQEGYSILIDKGDALDDDFNKSLLKLYNYFVEEKTPFRDTFPITLCPFTFTQNKEDLQDNKEFSDFIKSKANIKNFTADNVMDSLIKIYDLKEYELDDARVIIGIRYEIEKTLKSTGLMYEFASDIPITIITKIKENQADLKGIYIEPIFKRKYTYENFAGHILGRTGKISKSEFDELQNKGYQYNDLIGKDGIESVFEEYLKGSDGIKQIARDMNGRIIKTLNKKEPSSGSNVTLTIDKELQATAESSLKGHIEDLKATFKEGSIGSDIKGASIVVMDVNSGEVLSLANYPTVNLVDYNSNYESYRNDTLSPLINRAISSAYPCGSSFKMLTGIAALETNSINKDFSYNCSGRYKYFSDYQPTCFRNTAHGTVTIEKALKSSCNGFFFEAGRLTGISKLDEYAKMFGFGDRSGIELPGETSGVLASPEYKHSQSKEWTSTDTIQFSIGQSDNMFTTVQMAGYVSMIATNGKRYKTHIVKEIINPNTNEILLNKTPELVSNVNLKDSTINSIRNGMTLAISQGGSRKYFENCKVSVAGKTGTAEVFDGSSNGTFVCYAPIENPKIAIAITAEHIGEGSLLGSVAREVIDKYFETT